VLNVIRTSLLSIFLLVVFLKAQAFVSVGFLGTYVSSFLVRLFWFSVLLLLIVAVFSFVNISQVIG